VPVLPGAARCVTGPTPSRGWATAPDSSSRKLVPLHAPFPLFPDSLPSKFCDRWAPTDRIFLMTRRPTFGPRPWHRTRSPQQVQTSCFLNRPGRPFLVDRATIYREPGLGMRAPPQTTGRRRAEDLDPHVIALRLSPIRHRRRARWLELHLGARSGLHEPAPHPANAAQPDPRRGQGHQTPRRRGDSFRAGSPFRRVHAGPARQAHSGPQREPSRASSSMRSHGSVSVSSALRCPRRRLPNAL
jgi:hypothetical protein